MVFRRERLHPVPMANQTLNERLRQEACIYEAAFPPSVPEGRLLREPAAERKSRLVRILAKRRLRRSRA